jgi:hypothetical protein
MSNGLSEEKRKRLENALLPVTSGRSSRDYRQQQMQEMLPEISQPDYHFLFKKDEWSEDEVIDLFDQEDPEKLLDIISSSIGAEKLKARMLLKTDKLNGITYYFDPIVIVDWAAAKVLKIPDKVIEWRAQQSNTSKSKVTRNKYPPHQPSSSLGLNGHAILWQ